MDALLDFQCQISPTPLPTDGDPNFYYKQVLIPTLYNIFKPRIGWRWDIHLLPTTIIEKHSVSYVYCLVQQRSSNLMCAIEYSNFE